MSNDLLAVVVAVVAALAVSRFGPRPRLWVIGLAVLGLAWTFGGFRTLVGNVPVETVLVPVGLALVTGSWKRSGLASWLALASARFGSGRPIPILWAVTGVTFVVAALVGPAGAIALVLPVALLLAAELGVPALPFVVSLGWASLWGGLVLPTNQLGHLWLSYHTALLPWWWAENLLPPAVVATLAATTTVSLAYRNDLRATHERRARVLEFDVARSLVPGPRPWLIGALTLVLVTGLVLLPFTPFSPLLWTVSLVALILVVEGRGSLDRAFADFDGPTLLWWTGFALVSSLLVQWAVGHRLPDDLPQVFWLGIAAVVGLFVDPQALITVAANLAMPNLSLTHLPTWSLLLIITLAAGVLPGTSPSTRQALALAAGRPGADGRAYLRASLLVGTVTLVVLAPWLVRGV